MSALCCFVVPTSVLALDLNGIMHLKAYNFICENSQLDKNIASLYKLLGKSFNIEVRFWEYYDLERETFENDLYLLYENVMAKEPMNADKALRLLRAFKIMGRSADFNEVIRFFNLLFQSLENFETEQLHEILNVLCVDVETVHFIFEFLASENLKILEKVLCSCKAICDSPNQITIDCISRMNVMAHFLKRNKFRGVKMLLKHGVYWGFFEELYIHYCKRIDADW